MNGYPLYTDSKSCSKIVETLIYRENTRSYDVKDSLTHVLPWCVERTLPALVIFSAYRGNGRSGMLFWVQLRSCVPICLFKSRNDSLVRVCTERHGESPLVYLNFYSTLM